MRYSGFPVKAFIFLTLLALGACANRPHNNVLLFGTDTKFALDISSEATQSSYPEVTLGYKRREAVYMPLARNGYQCREDKKSRKIICTMETTDDKYMGKAEGDNTSAKGNDAYSVFASFGAKFDAGANSAGGLAQFFATGVAAQRLGQNPDVEKALSLRSGEAEAAIAENKALRAEANLESLKKKLKEDLGPEKYNEMINNNESQKKIRNSNIDIILKCADISNPEGKWKAILDYTQSDTSLSNVEKKWVMIRVKNKNPGYWKAQLNAQDKVTASMLNAVKKYCP